LRQLRRLLREKRNQASRRRVKRAQMFTVVYSSTVVTISCLFVF